MKEVLAFVNACNDLVKNQSRSTYKSLGGEACIIWELAYNKHPSTSALTYLRTTY
jgi:hypothetical protein